jgi:hypothetical protein
MSWERMPPLSTYPKARRKEMFRRVGGILVGRPQRRLLNLEEVQDTLGSYQQSYLGVRPIPIEDIIGSVARSSDFDDHFLPLSDRLEGRWQALENRYPDGGFPPISVFKIGEAYFVADGHHRVAIAKQRKVDFIDAEVTEIQTPFEVTADTDVTQLVHLSQQRIFMEESGLVAIAPGAQFTFTRPEGYPELLDNVKVHGWDMSMSRGAFVSREEIARDWFETVYLPTIHLIRESGLLEMCADATVDDVFLAMADRWRRLFPERGPLTFEEVIKDAAGEQSARLSTRARTAVDRIRKGHGADPD